VDSLTQLTLGAAVGEATLGRRVGRRALVWGAVCGTLPDLDVFIPFGDAVRDFTYHRGFSHSLFVLAALTPLVVWLILKFHPETRREWRGWFALVYLVFATHVLLDSFTVYGTQIFWPLPVAPVGWSTIFIIDPLYTVPLLIGVITALIVGRRSNWGWRFNAVGLTLSSLYLAWTVGAKLHVEAVAHASLQRQGVAYERLLTTPAPFNTLLWRVVATDDDGYYEGFYSILDGQPEMAVTHYPSAPELLNGIAEAWAVQRLQWFSKGFYAVAREGDAVTITDLRMGLEPNYVFRFKVGEIGNPHAVATVPERVFSPRGVERLRWVWERIWRTPAATAGSLTGYPPPPTTRPTVTPGPSPWGAPGARATARS
jgi:inner membrane protein